MKENAHPSPIITGRKRASGSWGHRIAGSPPLRAKEEMHQRFSIPYSLIPPPPLPPMCRLIEQKEILSFSRWVSVGPAS